MRTLKTSEAATLLNVSPNTLRAWERRFGYPRPQRSPGRHRLYTYGEITALRDALHEGLSISSAVSVAREALGTDTHGLVSALQAFEADRADQAMEATLALRPLERAVEEVMLPSLQELGRRHGFDSAPWSFAARWGGEWLRRAQRLSPPPTRPLSILFGDATRDDLDVDAPAIRALELFCARGGARLLCLPARGVAGLAEALAASRPHAVVIAGGHVSDDEVARWAYAVRSVAGALPVALYRRGLAEGRVRTTGARVLGQEPGEAQRGLIALAEGHGRSAPAPGRLAEAARMPIAGRRVRM